VSTLRESTGVRVPVRLARCGVVLLAAMGLLVSACGSGDEGSSPGAPETTAAVAGAQENSIIVPKSGQESGSIVPESSQENAVAVCKDWPAGTSVVPCAVGAMGPGGGRVFYDAGGEQSWGRFLEVAPQDWNGTGSDTPDGKGYFPCRGYAPALLLSGEAADTAWAIGGGRRNTEVLSQAVGCVDGTVSALTAATGYRGGGFSDWHLPSGGELTELCAYNGRSPVGGLAAKVYVSSTVGPSGAHTNFFGVNLGDAPTCTRTNIVYRIQIPGTTAYEYSYRYYSVRPVRAFSGPSTVQMPN
jgi:hypothetical protein